MPDKHKRIKYIDMSRGIAIFLVVLGHCIEKSNPTAFGNIFVILIYSFHIPLFFIISGLNFSVEKNFKSFIFQKMRRLMIPAYFFSAVLLLINFLEYHSITKRWLLRSIFQFRVIADGYWFLPTLFFSLLIVFVIHKIFNAEILRIISIVVISIIGAIYITVVKKPLPFSIDNAFFVSIFIEFGYISKKIFERKNNFFATIICIIIWSLLSYINCFKLKHGKMLLAYINIENPLLVVATGIFGSAMILIICNLIPKCKLLMKYGSNSLSIYIFNIIIIEHMKKFFAYLPHHNQFLYIIAIFVMAIFICHISYLISIIIVRYFPILFGINDQIKKNINS